MSDIRFNKWKHQSGTGGVVQNPSGNVCIGSKLPSSALDVGGDVQVTGVVTATTVSVGGSITAGNKLYGDGSALTGLASREFYGFTGIGSHLRLTYSNNGADNISGSDFAAFEDEFIGPSGISWSINNDGNLIATI